MSTSTANPAPWPALARRWFQYSVLALPAAVLAGLADWLGGGAQAAGGFWLLDAPYLVAWGGGAIGSLLVAVTLVWLMSKGSGLRLADLEPERGRTLLLTIAGLWMVAVVVGFLHRDDQDTAGAVTVAVWQMSYFNGLLARRIWSS